MKLYWKFLLLMLLSFRVGAVVEPQELSLEARKHVSKVLEFAYIQKAAEEIGVKIYLFGGSAAAYAHYVRWFMELQAGSENHQPERFDFDYTNIYRGNQDLDLVVDGTEAQASEFQKILKEKYAHIVGNKNDWEVRLLRAQTGDKLPLLDDPDFKNQHTDTNSTGMLDLTASDDEPVFRDLLDWENEESQFLKDVAAARIKYLFNPKHSTTSRYKEGKNPPIFSAVRYLAKLTQYEVEGREEDLKTIQRIINQTNFLSLSEYVQKKLDEFAIKTLLNSPDSEYAWDLMDALGLREKLIAMDRQRIQEPNTLSWWLNKEPLRSFPLGTSGRTAEEIFGVDSLVLSHETNNFQAYENITRSSRGEANVFISRAGFSDEAAVYGNGFYTKIGVQGARGTGLTIRFKLHPKAREGKDFIYPKNNNYGFVIVKNKKAITLIQENINISLMDYIKILLDSGISNNDLGLQKKLKRKFNRVNHESEEFSKAVDFVHSYFFISEDFPIIFDKADLKDLSKLELAIFNNNRYLNTADAELQKVEETHGLLQFPHWIRNLLEKGFLHREIVIKYLHKNGWEAYPEFLDILVEKGKTDIDVVRLLLSQKKWGERPELVRKIILRGQADHQVLVSLLTEGYSEHREEFLGLLRQNKKISAEVLDLFSTRTEWADKHDFVEALIQKIPLSGALNFLITKIIKKKTQYNPPLSAYDIVSKLLVDSDFWRSRPHLIPSFLRKIGKKLSRNDFYYIISIVKQYPELESGREILQMLMAIKSEDSRQFKVELIESIFSKPEFSRYADLFLQIFKKHKISYFDSEALSIIAATQHLWANEEFIDEVLSKSDPGFDSILMSRISQAEKPEKSTVENFKKFIKKAHLSPFTEGRLIDGIFNYYGNTWSKHPDVFETLFTDINKKTVVLEILNKSAEKLFYLVERYLDESRAKGDGSPYAVVLSKIAELTQSKQFSHIKYKRLVEKIITNGKLGTGVVFLFKIKRKGESSSKWLRDYPELLIKVIQKTKIMNSKGASIVQNIMSKNTVDNIIIDEILTDDENTFAPEVLVELVKKGTVDRRLEKKVFSMPEWRNHPELMSYLGSDSVTIEALRTRLSKIDFREWQTQQPLKCFKVL